MNPSTLLSPSDLKRVKQMCVTVDAQSIKIDGIKYIKLPLEKWKNDLKPSQSDS